MAVRVITIGGEHGSGRAPVARALAERLRWRLLDKGLIDEIARTARIETALALQYDESTDPWLHRMHKALWRGGYEGVASTAISDVFDADTMAELSGRVIREAARQGECVIVGRGSQCVLQDRDDAFHVFIYAPREERIERLRQECPGENPEALMESMDRRRETYIRRYFGQAWDDRHLYDLMLSSSPGQDAAVDLILAAIRLHRFPR